MKGNHYLKVDTPRIRYTFNFNRKINIIKDNSGTGKTSLVRYLDKLIKNKESRKINSSLNPVILTEYGYENIPDNSKGNLFIIDEESFVNTIEFSKLSRKTDNYFMIITRENLYNIPFSINSLYEINTTKKEYIINKITPKLYSSDINIEKLNTIITEDSGSGFQFFSKLQNNIYSTQGNSKLINFLYNNKTLNNALIVMDGAAFGAYIEDVLEIISNMNNVGIVCPESFEYLLLESDIFENESILNILKNPENYIDISEHLSWETYFYALLKEVIKDKVDNYKQGYNYLRYTMTYNKSKIGSWFLTEPQFSKVIDIFYSRYVNSLSKKLNW